MNPEKLQKTTCPRDCYDRCGILAVVRDGRVAGIRGDPDSPVSRGMLCAKCTIAYNGVWLDPARRVTQPLRRTGPKGEARFTEISWDEALDTVANRLQAIARDHGADKVLHAHYQGTYSAIACNFPCRFFHRYGATEVDPSTICDKAGHVALQGMFGTSFEGFDTRSRDDASCLVLWGVNPSHGGPLTDRFWVGGFSGTRIVIDPVRTLTFAQADIHLRPRPGTDSALAYGLLRLLSDAGRFDRNFLRDHVQGWQAVDAQIARTEPGAVADITGVPCHAMKRAADAMGAGPALYWLGIGLQRQRSGGDTVRAASLLAVATGSLGRRGGGLLYMNGYGVHGIDQDAFQRCAAVAEPPARIGHMGLAQALEDPSRSRAFFNWNTNVAASAPQQRRLHSALRREDLFTVVIDPFLTDTARFADIVLPAAHFLEFDDLVFSYFYDTVSAQVAVQRPEGSALPNQEIFRRLAARMGFADPDLHTSDGDMMRGLLACAAPGLDLPALRAAGTVFPRPTRVQFESRRFPTPSGRIEIDAPVFAQAGLGPAPAWPPVPGRSPGVLQLLSPSAYWLMCSSYGNDPRIRELLGEASVVLHPDDADRLGILPGDRVRLHSSCDSVEFLAKTSEDVLPGTAVTAKSRWPGFEREGLNVNALNPGLSADLGEGTAVNSLEVRIEVIE